MGQMPHQSMVLKNALRLTPAISECQAISRDFNTTMEGRPAQQAMPSRCTELDPGGHSIIHITTIWCFVCNLAYGVGVLLSFG